MDEESAINNAAQQTCLYKKWERAGEVCGMGYINPLFLPFLHLSLYFFDSKREVALAYGVPLPLCFKTKALTYMFRARRVS
jgi:hypothetical protein